MPRNRLNDRQQEFAKLLAQGMNSTDAYMQAFPGDYSRQSAAAKSYKLRKHPLIAAQQGQRAAIAVAAVDAACERYAVTAERVADAMARLAFTSMDQVASWHTEAGGDGKRRQVLVVRDSAEVGPDALQAVHEVRREAGGGLSVRLYNKREALMDLARIKGWIADKPVNSQALVMLKVER